MSDELTNIAKNDQAMTELNETIGRVCIAYRMMINVGIPAEAAAHMVAELNRRLLSRQFGDKSNDTWHL